VFFYLLSKEQLLLDFFPISSATMSCALTTISNPFLHASILVHLCQSPGPTFPSGMCLQTLKQRNDVIEHMCVDTCPHFLHTDFRISA
jgi:hypothetical protein